AVERGAERRRIARVGDALDQGARHRLSRRRRRIRRRAVAGRGGHAADPHAPDRRARHQPAGQSGSGSRGRNRREAQSVGVHAHDRARAGDWGHRVSAQRSGGVLTIGIKAFVFWLVVVAAVVVTADERALDFELVQPELFSANGGMPNAWADFDNDGDLDEFVGFRGRPNRLYRQDDGMFTDVAAAVGLADTIETRAAAWGDYDADGHVDLYVGFIDGTPNRLYRNDGDGRHFTDVAHQLSLDLAGVSRQVSWIDYDNDGDLDLFIAFRD